MTRMVSLPPGTCPPCRSRLHTHIGTSSGRSRGRRPMEGGNGNAGLVTAHFHPQHLPCPSACFPCATGTSDPHRGFGKGQPFRKPRWSAVQLLSSLFFLPC